jgi:hypothetical protein
MKRIFLALLLVLLTISGTPATLLAGQRGYGREQPSAYQYDRFGGQDRSRSFDRNGYYDRGSNRSYNSYEGDRYGYDRRDNHVGRSVAIIGGSAAGGALIGGLAGHGKGAAIGAVVGGVAGLVGDQIARHQERRR